MGGRLDADFPDMRVWCGLNRLARRAPMLNPAAAKQLTRVIKGPIGQPQDWLTADQHRNSQRLSGLV